MIEIRTDKPLFVGTININDKEFLSDFTKKTKTFNILLNSNNEDKHQEVEEIIKNPLKVKVLSIYNALEDLCKKGTLSIQGVNINFDEDIWDFSSLRKEGKVIGIYKMNLSSNKGYDYSDYQKTLIRLYYIHLIHTVGIHASSTIHKIAVTRNLFDYMCENNKFNLSELKLHDFENLTNPKNTYSTNIKIKQSIAEFMSFCEMVCDFNLNNEIKDWLEYADRAKVNAEIENNKIKLVHPIIYKNYVEIAKNYLYDESHSLRERGLAGLIYLETQLGLRPSEIVILRTGNLRKEKIGGKEMAKLLYESVKTSNSRTGKLDVGVCNLNKVSVEAYEYLNELFKEERETKKTTLLVPRITTNKSVNKTRKEYTTEEIAKFNIKMCAINQEKLGFNQLNGEKDNCHSVIYTKARNNLFNTELVEKLNLEFGDVIKYPSLKQCRVYVSTELQKRGVSDREIALHFNHKTDAMFGYYSRSTHKVQEDESFSDAVIAEVLENHLHILGPKGKAIEEKMKDITPAVAASITEIIEEIKNQVPIRKRYGGFCVKSNPNRKCSHDADVDEFMCAFNACPNHCFFFYQLTMTWERAKEQFEIYENNKKAGYIQYSQAELKRLKRLIQLELVPQIEETEKMILEHGKEWIIEKYPDMKNILKQLNKIKKEVEVWKSIN